MQLENKDKEYEIKLENKNKEYEIKLKKEKQLEKQEFLLKEFSTIEPIVYIIKVKSYDDGTYIIKIGESRQGIVNRYAEHKTNYEEILLLDCFRVQKSNEFESFLHNHRDIRPSRVKDLVGHEKENELFLIGRKLTYQNVLNIITYNIKNYNYTSKYDVEKEKLHNENLQILKDISKNDNYMKLIEEYFTKQSKELKEQNDNILNEIENLKQSNKEIIEKINKLSFKTTTMFNEPLVTVGPRLQKINPETFQLVKVYETVSELMREDIKYKRPSITKAVENNTIYYGFRWMLVNRDLDPTIVNIKPTKEIRTKIDIIGYIAKVDKNKTEIINVYLDRKIACKYNELKTYSLDNPVKNGSIVNNYYYILYKNCDKKLKEDFENKYGIPVLYINGIGQYDTNNNLIKEFVCKSECYKLLNISDKTLNKILEKNILYKNHYYKYIGNKDKMI